MLAELAERVKAAEVAARDLVVRSLARIERDDPELNAVVALRAEEALAEADRLDAKVREGVDPGPLAGLPVLVKDVEDVRGMVTTFGSRVLGDAPPAGQDGLVPARLRAAGAIVVGKSNCPEFAFEGYTANPLFGATGNPWASDWTPGGSSGGSAAALAAGMVPIATATDGGGSIRIPAAFCGLVGLKPTNGLVARRPIPAWIDLSTDGPLATTTADLALLLDVVRGPEPGDPNVPPLWHAHADRMPRRLLVAERSSTFGPLPESVGQAFEHAMTDLAGLLGVQAEPAEPAKMLSGCDADADWYLLSGVEQAHVLGEALLRDKAELFDPPFLRLMQEAIRIPTDQYLKARRRRFEYVRRFDELLGADCLLATPTLAMEGLLRDGRLPDAAVPGAPASYYNTTIANLTGQPALSMPAGVLPNGIPFGLQLTAPRWADDMLLNVAAAWEASHPWPRVAPGYEAFDSSPWNS